MKYKKKHEKLWMDKLFGSIDGAVVVAGRRVIGGAGGGHKPHDSLQHRRLFRRGVPGRGGQLLRVLGGLPHRQRQRLVSALKSGREEGERREY